MLSVIMLSSGSTASVDNGAGAELGEVVTEPVPVISVMVDMNGPSDCDGVTV